jgi:uncharacterized protein YgbK (DUF1537 family)
MEVFAFAGLDAVLFLDLPTKAQLAKFPSAKGIGIAGVSRSKSPDWMRANLPRYFHFLKELGAPLSFYKVCSTFDSSPDVGSIGCAFDIGDRIFKSLWSPLLVAAPPIGRWQAFGNLYASAPSGNHRLDRHPVMSKHPVTPMDEADLGRHLACQTNSKIGLIDLSSLIANTDAALERARKDCAKIISIDAMDDASLAAAGKLIWNNRDRAQFAIGSQGILYALITHWRREGVLAPEAPIQSAGYREKMIAISGSASAVTSSQIEWACDNGFEAIPFEASAVVDPEREAQQVEACIRAALTSLDQGNIPLIYTARGPDDPAISSFKEQVARSNLALDTARERIGSALGRVLCAVLEKTGIRRAVISGGDTSGHAASQLGLFALTALAPTVPAAALCKAHSEDPNFDGLELALKGGQMGGPDYFGAIRAGGGTT